MELQWHARQAAGLLIQLPADLKDARVVLRELNSLLKSLPKSRAQLPPGPARGQRASRRSSPRKGSPK